MVFVLRFLQIVILLFILIISTPMVISWLEGQAFKWGPFLGTLGLFGAMLAMLEALIRARKKREAQKAKYTQECIRKMDRLEFYLSKSRGVMGFILLLLLVLSLMWFGAIENSPIIEKISSALRLGEDRWLAFWGYEIALLAFLVHSSRHLYILHIKNAGRPYLSIDDSGVYSPLLGKLDWRDVVHFNLIKRTVQYSELAFLRVTFRDTKGEVKHKDIALKVISELEPDILFTVAEHLREKYGKAGTNAVPDEFRQELDKVDVQLKEGASLMEKAEPGSAEYFRAMKQIEQGMRQMEALGDGIFVPPKKFKWDRTLKTLKEKKASLKNRLGDAHNKWMAYLSLLETRAREGQAVDMEQFNRNRNKSFEFTQRLNAQIKKIDEQTRQRMNQLFRYQQFASVAFGLLVFGGIIYLQM